LVRRCSCVSPKQHSDGAPRTITALRMTLRCRAITARSRLRTGDSSCATLSRPMALLSTGTRSAKWNCKQATLSNSVKSSWNFKRVRSNDRWTRSPVVDLRYDGGGARGIGGVSRVRSALAQRTAGRFRRGTVVRLCGNGRDRIRMPVEPSQEISSLADWTRERLATGAHLAGTAELLADPISLRIPLGARAGVSAHVALRCDHRQRHPGRNSAELLAANDDGACGAGNAL